MAFPAASLLSLMELAKLFTVKELPKQASQET